MQGKRFLTIAQAADYLSIKRSKAYEMSSREALPGKVRFDGVVRVDRLVLDDWIAEQIGKSGGANGSA